MKTEPCEIAIVTFYGIFSDTSVCPILNSLKLNIYTGFPSDWQYVSSVRLAMVQTFDNSSVYAASLTLAGDYHGNVMMSLSGLPKQVQVASQVSIYFSLATAKTVTTSSHFPNETTDTVS